MLPAPDMSDFPSCPLEDETPNFFRHDGFSVPELPVLKPGRWRMGEEEPSTAIMIQYLLVQTRERKRKQGTQILPGDELGQMGEFLFRILGQVDVLNPAARFLPVGLGCPPFVGFFQKQKDSLDGAVGKDPPPGKTLFPMNASKIFPQSGTQGRCFLLSKDSSVGADLHGDGRRLLSPEQAQELGLSSRISMDCSHHQKARKRTLTHTHPSVDLCWNLVVKSNRLPVKLFRISRKEPGPNEKYFYPIGPKIQVFSL